ncbi:8-oxo-dGTP diphosphatase [Desulfuromusa kysingii]|uniref:8-oxo-dGTP diphosphatase n=1 Tax=Desulfuromusa kysingii TaxID=37625 RepID=A0A1H3W0L9_9BACT|nr:NUDIX hydrolase [Desulfuromusa kysingii]SDZ80607.1 8-oxo-dGTP diphosphatase [Desulfuromusa kysingii]
MKPEPKHLLVVSCLIRNPQNQLLLVKHHIRGWELPQGKVEEGENLIFALSREVLEETGVTISHAKLAVIWSKVSAPAALIFCFNAHYASGELTPSEETPGVEWCSEAEAGRRVSHPANRDRIISMLESDGSLQFRSYATGPYRVLN